MHPKGFILREVVNIEALICLYCDHQWCIVIVENTVSVSAMLCYHINVRSLLAGGGRKEEGGALGRGAAEAQVQQRGDARAAGERSRDRPQAAGPAKGL